VTRTYAQLADRAATWLDDHTLLVEV